MTQKDIDTTIRISVKQYGREATIKALNKMFHDGLITSEQAIASLDTLNSTEITP